jgi:hypothetical protein
VKHVPDIAFVLALAALARGCYLAHPAAGWIVPSVVVLGIVVSHHFCSPAEQPE